MFFNKKIGMYLAIEKWQVYKKTTCQFQIMFTTDNYLHMYKTLQLVTMISVVYAECRK